jgi:hypothetical protein
MEAKNGVSVENAACKPYSSLDEAYHDSWCDFTRFPLDIHSCQLVMFSDIKTCKLITS